MPASERDFGVLGTGLFAWSRKLCNLCWGESQKGLGWEGPLKVHLDHGRDISHLIRLLRVQSNQTSNVLNDGALTTSLGMLC